GSFPVCSVFHVFIHSLLYKVSTVKPSIPSIISEIYLLSDMNSVNDLSINEVDAGNSPFMRVNFPSFYWTK
ncbi:MAG: hypothetical protein U0937_00470, partial [Thermodesulfovibrionia bacterium]|nr:hypothetical protein [Thermodesulfovibrionia bacterium]